MNVIELAREIAQDAHARQEYITGTERHPYFEAHLEPVANIVGDMGYGDKTIAAAYLHDVIEDTNVTDEYLLKIGIPNDVVEAVVALTHNDKETLSHYIARVCLVPRAVVAKFADSTFNLDTTIRTKDIVQPEVFQRRKSKYDHNLRILKPLLPSIEELSA